MSTIPTSGAASRTAHPLFPADQAFLWLPGFSGEHSPYCTYNEFRADPPAGDHRRFNRLPEHDSNGARFIPPYPVSRETHIAWHTNVNPPYPYHPVPLRHSLSAGELEELARTVSALMNERAGIDGNPLAVLNNNHKSYILTALATMGLLPPHPESPPIPAVRTRRPTFKKQPSPNHEIHS